MLPFVLIIIALAAPLAQSLWVSAPRGTGAGLLVEPRSANAGALLGPQYVENQLQSRDLQDLLNRIDERESPPFMQRGASDRTKREARFKTAINMLQRRSPPSPKLPASGNLSPEHGQQLPQIPQTPNRTPASTGGAPVSGNSPPQGQSPIRAAGANPPNQGQSSGGGSTRTSIDVHMGETKSSEDGSPVRISMLTGCTAIFFYGRDDHGKAVLVGSHVRLRHDGGNLEEKTREAWRSGHFDSTARLERVEIHACNQLYQGIAMNRVKATVENLAPSRPAPEFTGEPYPYMMFAYTAQVGSAKNAEMTKELVPQA